MLLLGRREAGAILFVRILMGAMFAASPSTLLFSAMGGIKDEYVLSSADLLGYTKEDDELNSDKTIRLKRTTRMLLIAAAVTVLLAATAFAAIFALSHRVPDRDETFRIQWSDGYLEWTDAKLVLTFPDTPESREISFRPGWLPEEMASLQTGEWTSRMTAGQSPGSTTCSSWRCTMMHMISYRKQAT